MTCGEIRRNDRSPKREKYTPLHTSTFRDYLHLHLVILAWGFTAVLGKLIEIPPVEVVMWRTGLASFGFAAVAKWLRQSLILNRSDQLTMMSLGALLGLHWLLFFASARLSTASVCLAAMPTMMLWCSLIEPWVDGSRRWRPWELLVGSIILGAVWLIYEVEFRYWQGFSVGIVAALLAAIFSVANKRCVSRIHYAVMGCYQMIGAFVACALVWPFLGLSFSVPTPTDFLAIFVLASLCTVWAYAGYMKVLRKLSVFTVNVFYNLEPLYGMALAVLIFGSEEHMSGGFYTGASIIIGSVFLVPWIQQRRGTRT